MFDFNEQFFEKHQKNLLKIANSKYLKWLLGLNKVPDEATEKKIAKITPNSIHFVLDKEKREIKGLFFSRPRFAEALAYCLSPFAYLQQINSTRRVWKFSPVGLAYTFIFGLFGLLKGFPVIMATTDFYSGEGDGCVSSEWTYEDLWTTVIDQDSGSYNSGTLAYQSNGLGAVSAGYYDGGAWMCGRSFYPQDTSAIGSDSTITNATFKFYEKAYRSGYSMNIGLVESTQDSDTSLSNDDYNNVGTTEFASRISYIGSGYRTFTLNASGLSFISKTGYTKLALRSNYDLDRTNPPNGNGNAVYAGSYYSENTGTEKDPYLSVTYTVPATSTFISHAQFIN